ncbi:hypothetical protein BDP27DRAFT_1292170 [Rhodocollybia butyracea]|uniref:Uncharacterized protein n=1 Tax=Rhodocollybia butyracea TaxID=206335 RepID=A0A9P5PVV4_9AGAR|nr:hypothetical protein BDP27DRAFT_1302324 [Rhodocollybia butyracea]KAF9070898.1 hypothetical protein BDP27DRAFT_1292170 [Rhodocollybia butyracea]
MHTLKNPLSFRPSSRPTSPAPPSRPDSGIGMERSKPLTKLSLNNLRRASPAPLPSPPLAPLIQDGSYLEMLSLKLSEAVSKAVAQPFGSPAVSDVIGGKRPIPIGRGSALGALIISELKSANGNPHLHRAIVRSLQRPLSVLFSNLSTMMVPLLSSPAFLTPSAPTTQSPNSNAVQLHALAIAALAGELLEAFDDLHLGFDNDARGDGLKAIREGLVSLVHRVVNPLIGGIRNELVPVLDALELSNPAKVIPGSKHGLLHSSIVTLQSIIPVYTQALKRYTSSRTAQNLLAPFVISLVWRTMVAICHRPATTSSPPSSPVPQMRKRRGSPSATPPLTPPPTRFTIKLPSSRPPSPPVAAPVLPLSPAADVRALVDLFITLPVPVADTEGGRLAREAVDEALNGLRALADLFDMVTHLIRANDGLVEDKALVEDKTLELQRLTEKIPTLIALPILLRAQGLDIHSETVLGLSEEDYRNSCLTGFGRADECGTLVGMRVYEYLCTSEPIRSVLLAWLEMEIIDE